MYIYKPALAASIIAAVMLVTCIYLKDYWFGIGSTCMLVGNIINTLVEKNIILIIAALCIIMAGLAIFLLALFGVLV